LKTLFIVTILLTFFSFVSNEQAETKQIIGVYNWKPYYGVAMTIELKEDGTFKYKWRNGLISGTTFGKWRRKGASVILNSDLQPPIKEIETEGFEIVKTERTKSDSLSITVIEENDLLPFAICILKSDSIILTGSYTELNGKVKLPKFETADSLIVDFVGHKTIRLKLDDSISSYVLKMYPDPKFNTGNYHYFTEEIWTFENEQLCSPKGEYVEKSCYDKIK